jgi:O-antigen/teichoic acid export membrane protein
MKSSALMLKGGVNLGTGQIINQVCSFVKSVILANLLTKADYGIASVFALALAILEMTNNLSASTLIVQSKEGDDPKFQNTAHFLLLTRGVVNSLILFLIARPVASLFGITDVAWAFRLIALVPLIRGFYHLDLDRFQRQMRFGPLVTAGLVSTIAGTIAALVFGLWLRSYVAMIGVTLVQTVFLIGASHVLAQRSYKFEWNRSFTRKMFHFGWPLMINGFLMYVIFEGDRVAIGTAKQLFGGTGYSMSDLGTYSVAFALSMAAATPIVSVASSLFLPMLSKAQDHRPEFNRIYHLCTGMLYFAAGTVASLIIINGEWIIRLLYKSKYDDAVVYLGWLSCMWALRILRSGPTMAAMAHADSKNAMISNIVRNIALIGVIVAAATGAPVIWIAISGFIGELAALVVCLWRLQKVHSISSKVCIKPGIAAGGSMILAYMMLATGIGKYGMIGSLFMSALLMAVFIYRMHALYPQYRAELGRIAI